MMPASSASESNNVWDCYHINSIDEGPDHSLLISMRNMWAIYKIDKETGRIIWQLGGKQNDFDFCNMTANAVQEYFHDPALYVPGQGNVQKLPNGNHSYMPHGMVQPKPPHGRY